METQANKFSSPLIWVAGVAITLFCATGIGAIMGWIPTSMGRSNDVEVSSTTQNPISNPVKSHSTSGSASTSHVASSAPVHSGCSQCGVVESTHEVVSKGEGSGVGAVGGAVVGGLLGHQIGNGRGNEVATVVGAVGGVVAGNEIEKRVKSTKSYDVTVRMEDGSSRVIHEASAPGWRNGDRVKIVDGAIREN